MRKNRTKIFVMFIIIKFLKIKVQIILNNYWFKLKLKFMCTNQLLAQSFEL